MGRLVAGRPTGTAPGADAPGRVEFEGLAGPRPREMAEQRAIRTRYSDEIHAAGVVVANNGLAGADMATTVRVRDGETR